MSRLRSGIFLDSTSSQGPSAHPQFGCRSSVGEIRPLCRSTDAVPWLAETFHDFMIMTFSFGPSGAGSLWYRLGSGESTCAGACEGTIICTLHVSLKPCHSRMSNFAGAILARSRQVGAQYQAHPGRFSGTEEISLELCPGGLRAIFEWWLCKT